MGENAILYNTIGTGYNATRQADPEITQKLFKLLTPKPDGRYLDVGCGTGNYTIALNNLGLNFCGVEPSEIMLDVAKSKSSYINWLLGTAENIPLATASMDGAIATLTIHHWPNLANAFAEVKRVLKLNARSLFLRPTPGK